MRCLILGASGQIGSSLVSVCADRGLAHLGTYYRRPQPEFVPLDIRDADAVGELVADYQPDVTFLAAGMADNLEAEAQPRECRQITVDGAGHVAAAVARSEGHLVLVSSDEVFGECATARREEDPLSPMGVRARCLAAAEGVVRTALPERHLILRTGWVFGPEGENLGTRLRTRLAEGERVEGATDRHGQPTFGPDFADVAVELARLGQVGTFHVVGPDRHTEFTFARLAAHIFGFDAELVEARDVGEQGDGSPRPQRVWLDRFKLRSLLGARAIRGAADGLRAMRQSGVSSTFSSRAA